jgi:hypothetical protein
MHGYNFRHLLQTSELYQQGAPLCPDAVVPTTEKQHWPLIIGRARKLSDIDISISSTHCKSIGEIILLNGQGSIPFTDNKVM